MMNKLKFKQFLLNKHIFEMKFMYNKNNLVNLSNENQKFLWNIQKFNIYFKNKQEDVKVEQQKKE